MSHSGSEVLPKFAPARTLAEWPLEELRTKKATADLYRMVYGTASARWIMEQLGFPKPPSQLVVARHQWTLNMEA